MKYLTDWPVLLAIKFYIKLKNQSINNNSPVIFGKPYHIFEL